MFTGIVIEQGVVEHAPPQLVLRAPQVAADVAIGDSVAVDGCCLTVTAVDGPRLQFDAVPETLRRTTLGGFAPGSTVNLEPALRAGDRLGGHVVQGHVDGVGELVSAEPEGDAVNLTFAAPEPVLRYVIEKGSITVNGVSLTVNRVEDFPDGCEFSVNLIPHTLQHTTLGELSMGSRINLEIDLIARYVERMLTGAVPRP
jgi:riboflavin synthase